MIRLNLVILCFFNPVLSEMRDYSRGEEIILLKRYQSGAKERTG